MPAVAHDPVRPLLGRDAEMELIASLLDGVRSAGAALLHDAYARIFDVVRLSVEFTIDELVVASDEVAYALTRSNGTQTTLATGAESAESNREVFIFGRRGGDWKISRYLFNKPR